MEELQARYDSRASFYRKAFIRTTEDENVEHQELLSYGILVANYVYYKNENKKVYEVLGNYSQTTTRHQKEFFRQLGLIDEEIKELFKNGRYEEVI